MDDKFRSPRTSEIGLKNSFILSSEIHQKHIFKTTSYICPRDVFLEIATSVNKVTLTVLKLF